MHASTRTATLDPSTDLTVDGTYTAALIGGASAIRDSTGTPLSTMSWSYTSGAAPAVIGTAPVSNAKLVRRTNNVTVTFSEPVRVSTRPLLQ